MRFEPGVYLNAILRDFRLAGGRVVAREFESVDQLLSLDAPVLVNCTGLGAKELFGDEELHPDVDYMTVGGGGEWSLEPSPTEMKRVMSGNIELFAGMA